VQVEFRRPEFLRNEAGIHLNSSHPEKNAVAVSIGMPVYNGEKYLAKALDSILSQTFRDFELIISDNASTDGKERICRSFGEKDKRVKFFRNEENRGAAWNFQRVFRLSRGEYFQWACHDDVWTPTLLERCVAVLQRQPETVLCYSKAAYIDATGNPIERNIERPSYEDPRPHVRFGSFLRYHHRPNECSQVLGLFRTSILGKTSLIDAYPASDMILLGEVALHGTFHEIPEPLFLRRDHSESSVKANPTYEERAAWFDPSKRGKIQLPTWRWFFEWIKSIARSPISPVERILCVGELLRWAWGNKGNMRRELKSVFRRMIPIRTA